MPGRNTPPLLPSDVTEQSLSTRFVKFALVGLSGVFVNLGTLALLVVIDVHQSLASALAIQVSILSNFVVHEWWTFRDRRHASHLWRRVLSFQGVSMVGAALQWVTFIIVCLMFFRWTEGAVAFDSFLQTLPAEHLDAAIWVVRYPPSLGHQIYVAQLVGIGCSTTWNFAANVLWTWRKQESHPNSP